MIATARRISVVEEYYFSKKLAEVRALGSAGTPVINLGIGSPDQAPSAQVIATLVNSANNSLHHGYQNYKGVPVLRNAIADFYGRTYHAVLDPEKEILPLIGSKEGIMHITMAFVNEGEEVLIPDPGYPTYSSVANLVGACIRTYDLVEDADWAIDIDALEKSDLSKVKLMWINFPHMPTGRPGTVDELNRLVALARKHQFLIVNDNPYSLILNPSPLSIFSISECKDVAMELNSLSKSHNMAGWRIGWVAGRQEHIEAVLKVKSNMDSGMFLGLQHAAVEALSQEQKWFDQLNTMYQKRKKIAQEILDLMDAKYNDNQSGLFIWAKVPPYISNVEQWIDEILYSAKVFITPGFIFGKNGKRFIRISLCASEDMLVEAKERIRAFIAETQPAKKMLKYA